MALPKEKSYCQARPALWLGLQSCHCVLGKIPCLMSSPDRNWSPERILGTGAFSHNDGVHPWPCVEQRHEARQLSLCLLQGWRTYLGLILPRLNFVPCWRYLKLHPGVRFPHENHRIIKLEKTSKIKTSHQSNTTKPAEPCPEVPYLHIF